MNSKYNEIGLSLFVLYRTDVLMRFITLLPDTPYVLHHRKVAAAVYKEVQSNLPPLALDFLQRKVQKDKAVVC